MIRAALMSGAAFSGPYDLVHLDRDNRFKK
jgi:hypothetical protein